jgi:NAD(P)-dependent dehydrogenase (short-subunit alcohol dehydrogenase family)
VVVHYHQNRTAADVTAQTLAGDVHLVVQADIADAGQVKQMVDTAVAHYGRIDILINNAATYNDHPLADTSYEAWQTAWRTIIDTNLIGPANVCWCVGQQMIRQGHGRIVNVSSRGAFRGEPTAPAYGASKAGLNAMSQSLAKHLAPYNIFVGVIAPGFVETEMAKEHLKGETGREIRAQSPLNRVATPAEVAYPVLFLASEGAEWLTGAVLDANGASYLRT